MRRCNGTYGHSRFIADGSITDKRLLIQFPDYGLDGMRCDVDGNLYAARWGKGTVAKISPQGKLLREIDVLGAKPTNVCFGGTDGRTCYVTEVEHGRLVQFRVDRPGLEWQRPAAVRAQRDDHLDLYQDLAKAPGYDCGLAGAQGFRKHHDFTGAGKLFKNADGRISGLQGVDYGVGVGARSSSVDADDGARHFTAVRLRILDARGDSRQITNAGGDRIPCQRSSARAPRRNRGADRVPARS